MMFIFISFFICKNNELYIQLLCTNDVSTITNRRLSECGLEFIIVIKYKDLI